MNFGKYRQNWLKHETNEERVDRVIQVQVIEPSLILPWIKRILIQEVRRCEANDFPGFQSSWITRVTDPSDQINRPLMSLHKPSYFSPLSHPVSIKMSFKPLATFAKSLIWFWISLWCLFKQYLTVRNSSNLRDLIIHPIILNLKYKLNYLKSSFIPLAQFEAFFPQK